MIKKILITLVVVFILIQFIRPAKNINNERITNDDLSNTYATPEAVHHLLITKCYDCHSNHTNYPWYFNFQPVAWWLADHINEGKRELNFSEFKNYGQKKALHKLEEMGEVIKEGSMPLQSYTLLHPETVMSPEEKRLIFDWLKSLSVDTKGIN